MREIKKKSADDDVLVEERPASSSNDVFVDLGVMLEEDPTGAEEENEEESEEGSEGQTETTTGNEGEEEDRDPEDFDDFEKGLKDKFEEYIENPEELAEMLIGLGNVGRIVFLPTLYEGLMYPGQERNDIRGVLEKVHANEKRNAEDVTEGLNNYEKRLYGKWPKLQGAIQNVSYTQKEIKKLAKLLAKRMQTMTVAVWMEKYDWIIYLFYLEFTKSSNIWSSKAEDYVAKKFNL